MKIRKMKKYPLSKFYTFLIIFCSIYGLSVFTPIYAQSLAVGMSTFEDYYRQQQLLGNLKSDVSFSVRPIYPRVSFEKSSIFFVDNTTSTSKKPSYDEETEWKILPVNFTTQINTGFPYGWNDGPMIPAKGLQTYISAGVYTEIGPFSLQLNPEIVFATNDYFDELAKEHYEIIIARYYDAYNKIDLPARFGNSAYAAFNLGQSSIRYNNKSLSVGLSSENLWWGPGRKNSLLMSNSAPGFFHFTLNTLAPLKSPIGSFEGQLIGGLLTGSGYEPLAESRSFQNSPLTVELPDSDRYLSGITLVYQPKWVPGLFLGFGQTKQLYTNDLDGFTDYLPFSTGNKKDGVSSPLNLEDIRRSVFFRWLWPEENAEIYFEYGRSNVSNNTRDNLLQPNQSRAYTFGLNKLFPFGSRDSEYLSIGLEATQLQQTDEVSIDVIDSWYAHPYVRHGYTQVGQMIGAGIGPGANVQSLDMSWVKGLKRLGLVFERYVHNNDLYFYMFKDSFDFRRHWVDLSVGAVAAWDYKNFVFHSKIQATNAFNYQWYLEQRPENPYMVNGRDAFNLHVKLGLNYRF